MNIGKNVEHLRKLANLSQAELSRRALISAPMIHYIENDMKTPSLEVAQRIAKVLDCTIDEIVNGKTA